MKKTGIFALVSGELIGSVGGGFLLGKWLDKLLHSAPVLSAILAILGLIYSVWRLNRISKTWFKSAGENSNKR